jgi:AmmeMemoRadiSam system protein B/AmmeMemoRadiSam system protein A
VGNWRQLAQNKKMDGADLSNNVRPAAVAGSFYPGQPPALQADVDRFLEQAATDAACPKAIVVPHAGFIYSGSTAATAYARVRNGRDRISRVVLLGPSHRVGFTGIATTTAEFYTTPLGQVPLDKQGLNAIRGLPQVGELDEAHAQEHSLEVHLPFLQRCLEGFTLLPLVVGQTEPQHVARVLNAVWGGPETLVVISSDLSHYLPYEDARARDAATSRKILARESDLTGEQACGCRPLNGLLQVLRERNLEISALQVCNSGDTAGDRSRVVGYGAYVVDEEPNASTLDSSQRQQLLFLARGSILQRLQGRNELRIPRTHYDPGLSRRLASFVTLNRGGQLRGCIGSLVAHRSLLEDVAHNAVAAAFRDSRFKPLRASEYPEVELHISVLSRPAPLAVNSRQELASRLRPGVDGLVLEERGHRATYLPSVWSQLPDPDQFVGELRRKAGLPREGWSNETRVSIYQTEEFS